MLFKQFRINMLLNKKLSIANNISKLKNKKLKVQNDLSKLVSQEK